MRKNDKMDEISTLNEYIGPAFGVSAALSLLVLNMPPP